MSPLIGGLILIVILLGIAAIVLTSRGDQKSKKSKKCCKPRRRCCPTGQTGPNGLTGPGGTSVGAAGPTGVTGPVGDVGPAFANSLFAFNLVQQGGTSTGSFPPLVPGDLIQFPTIMPPSTGWIHTGGTNGDTFTPLESGRYVVEYDIPLITAGALGAEPKVILDLQRNGVPVPGSGSAQDSDDLTTGTVSKQVILELVAGETLTVQVNLSAGSSQPSTLNTTADGVSLGPCFSAFRIS